MFKKSGFLMFALLVFMPFLLQAETYRMKLYKPTGVFAEIKEQELVMNVDYERRELTFSIWGNDYVLPITNQTHAHRDDVRITSAKIQEDNLVFWAMIFDYREYSYQDYHVTRGHLSLGETEYGKDNSTTDLFVIEKLN